MIVFAKDIQASGVASFDGGAAGGSYAGGGAGGAILLACQTATLGTNKFTATGGSGGASGGGAGAVGRISIHHSGSVSGTTNPTYDDTSDSFTEGVVTSNATGLTYFM